MSLYADCHYAECRYARCHYAECRGAFIQAVLLFWGKIRVVEEPTLRH